MRAYFHLGSEATDLPQYSAPDHAIASAELLESLARRLREGESGYELGPELVLIARVIARGI